MLSVWTQTWLMLKFGKMFKYWEKFKCQELSNLSKFKTPTLMYLDSKANDTCNKVWRKSLLKFKQVRYFLTKSPLKILDQPSNRAYALIENYVAYCQNIVLWCLHLEYAATWLSPRCPRVYGKATPNSARQSREETCIGPHQFSISV